MRRAPIFATAEAVEEAFYDAMQRGDAAGMIGLWADDEDVVCVHPNGSRLVGLPAVRAAWEEILSGGGVDIRPTEVRIYQGAMLAVHNLIEKVLVTTRSGPEVIECVVTNVYAKGAGGWRMVLHQSAAVGDEQATAAARGDTLH